MDTPPEQPAVRTLWSYFVAAWRKQDTQRPSSMYLLLTVPIVLLLGLQVVHVRHDAAKFALLLTLFFVFFFVLLWRALVDCFEILTRTLKDRQELFRTTLGDEQFIKELGRRTAQHGATDERSDASKPAPPGHE